VFGLGVREVVILALIGAAAGALAVYLLRKRGGD
jgi:hypothetical protein